MAQPYVGEIRLVGFSFAPVGWAECNGQLLSINENETLFQLIGTTYGGDGQTTFALPNLQSRALIGQGTASSGINYIIGEQGGVESVTLTSAQIPAHTHTLQASSAAGTTSNPQGKVYAQVTNATRSDRNFNDSPNQQAAGNMVTVVGGSQPHENRQPFLCLKYIIALEGIFPTPN